MNIAIDTNRYTDFARGVPEVIQQIRIADLVVVPFIVVAELRAGFQAGTKLKENEAVLGRFLHSDRTSVAFPDEKTIDHFSILYAQLRRQGTLIPNHDIWIAAIALQHGLTLYARDVHFDHIPQLARL